MTSQLNSNFNSKYLRSETWYRQLKNGLGSYRLFPIVS